MTLPSPIRAIGVVPPRTALTASPPPLNGTRTQSAPFSSFELLHVEHERRRGAEIAQRAGLLLRQRTSSSTVFTFERRNSPPASGSGGTGW